MGEKRKRERSEKNMWDRKGCGHREREDKVRRGKMGGRNVSREILRGNQDISSLSRTVSPRGTDLLTTHVDTAPDDGGNIEVGSLMRRGKDKGDNRRPLSSVGSCCIHFVTLDRKSVTKCSFYTL